MTSDGMTAKLVYDYTGTMRVPAEMGTPADGQLRGTPAEQLTELAGRVCYDSLGKGRDSDAYHVHINETRHGSVQEHYNFTVELQDGESYLPALLNRPGVHVEPGDGGSVRVTLNLRAAREWREWGVPQFRDTADGALLAMIARVAANRLAPRVVVLDDQDDETYDPVRDSDDDCYIVEPVSDEECWLTLYMSGSRGFSHELVRHKYRTAVSQRSTRYVDESEGAWVTHPLLAKYMHSVGREVDTKIENVYDDARELYDILVLRLQTWLIDKGADKLTARKQGRGAARGYLGNALSTELIFSASVAQWRRMLDLRACAAADAEIREIFCRALPELQGSQYGDRFRDYELTESPDGIGQVAAKHG